MYLPNVCDRHFCLYSDQCWCRHGNHCGQGNATYVTWEVITGETGHGYRPHMGHEYRPHEIWTKTTWDVHTVYVLYSLYQCPIWPKSLFHHQRHQRAEHVKFRAENVFLLPEIVISQPPAQGAFAGSKNDQFLHCGTSYFIMAREHMQFAWGILDNLCIFHSIGSGCHILLPSLGSLGPTWLMAVIWSNSYTYMDIFTQN